MINLDWIKDYIDISNYDLKELAVKITQAGINVEKVITNHIDNLVIGLVTDCIPHPDSDHLHICKVDVGEENLQIVCGAKNIKKGLKVIVAKIGAVLPNEFEIKKSIIRGIESNGMICALFELGLEENTDDNYDKGIEELPMSFPIGKDPLTYLGLDDTIYELDIHKHRNNDCYYHIGFAYEIGAIIDKKVQLPDDKYKVNSGNIKNHFKLEVATKNCPYYLAKMVTNITIKESPSFIQKRLLSVGMRPINNVVDISNYVMLEYGQPLHFFDKDKLGDNILVRDAKNDETIITLDNKERQLTSNDIIITDGSKAVCIAGVMGGANTEVSDTTKTLLIESAIFSPTNIRNTAKNLNLISEASIRYGKGLNYEYTMAAIDRACHLLEKYADATILDGIVKYDVLEKSKKTIRFNKNDINRLLGIEISTKDMEKELTKLGFVYELNNDDFIVTIPNRRLDIEENINDIAEEIGRLYGYNNLISTLPKVNVRSGAYAPDVKFRKIVSKRLRNLGLNECKTYTLISKEKSSLFNYDNLNSITLPNPMSEDKMVIRTGIISSLLEIYEYNKKRKVDDILIYEVSKVYDSNYNEISKVAILMKGNYFSNLWQNNISKIDFYVIKGIIENLLDYLGFKNRYSFNSSLVDNLHDGMSADICLDKEKIGIIGRIHPSISKDNIFVAELNLNKLLEKKVKPIKYKEPSKYPSIKKDLAFIVDKSITSETIRSIIEKAGGRIVTNVEVFDLYTGNNISKNEKSIAYNITFADPLKTLTDEEVMIIFNRIIKEVEDKCHAKLRKN